jgi:hypothetical protein
MYQYLIKSCKNGVLWSIISLSFLIERALIYLTVCPYVTPHACSHILWSFSMAAQKMLSKYVGWPSKVKCKQTGKWKETRKKGLGCGTRNPRRKMLDLQHQYNNCTTIPHMRVGPTYCGPPSCEGLLCSCCIGIVQESNPILKIRLLELLTV